MRIFLDANILFSAAKSDGAVRELLSVLRSRGAKLCVDPYVIEEARRNLAAKSPDSVHVLNELLPSMELIPTTGSPSIHIRYELPDKDRPVMDAAIRGQCDVLVTGDKTHFGNLYGTRVEGVEVLSPAQLAEIILAQKR